MTEIAYAVRMSDGHYVGICRATADVVCSKQPAAHGDEVVEMVPASDLAKARAECERLTKRAERAESDLTAYRALRAAIDALRAGKENGDAAE